MDFCDLDQRLVTWGAARQTGGRWAVAAAKSRQDADIDAGISGGILVYYHPDLGWTSAATGHPITT